MATSSIPTRRTTPLALAAIALVAVLVAAIGFHNTGPAEAHTYTGVHNYSNSYSTITIETHVTAPRTCTTGPPQKCTLRPGYYQWTLKPGQWTNQGRVQIPGVPHRVYLNRGCRRWSSVPGQTINPGWNHIGRSNWGTSFRVWGCR